MKEKKQIFVKEKNIDKDMQYTLLELITYYNLSYPVGCNEECGVYLDDSASRIITENTVYNIEDSLYVRLYLISNKIISEIYKNQ